MRIVKKIRIGQNIELRGANIEQHSVVPSFTDGTDAWAYTLPNRSNHSAKHISLTSGATNSSNASRSISYLNENRSVGKIWEHVVWQDRVKSLDLVLVALAIPLLLLGYAISRGRARGGDLASDIYVTSTLHCCFCFVVGWINCITVLRYNIFATMMVGNTVLMGVAWVCQNHPTAHSGLCPDQIASVHATYYAIIISLFLFGSCIHGFIHANFSWPSWAFAPVLFSFVVAEELLSFHGYIQDSHGDLYWLAPIFGITASITAKSGLGAMPFASTGNMVSIGYHLGKLLVEFKSMDAQRLAVNLCLWLSFLLGIVAGAHLETELSLMCTTLALGALCYANSVVFPLAGSVRK